MKLGALDQCWTRFRVFRRDVSPFAQAAGKKRTWHEAIASESLASPSLPSIYDIANKRTRQEAKTSTKQEKEKHEKRDKKEKEKVPHKSKTEVQQSQVTGRGLMGALEAARAEATKMRTIARSFASAWVLGRYLLYRHNLTWLKDPRCRAGLDASVRARRIERFRLVRIVGRGLSIL